MRVLWIVVQQLELHTKPISLLDVDGYFTGLLAFVEHMLRAGFVRELDARRILAGEHPGALLDRVITEAAGS